MRNININFDFDLSDFEKKANQIIKEVMNTSTDIVKYVANVF